LSRRILVVDDEQAIVKLVSYHLERDGYSTVPCYDGESALRLIREQCFDLVILDLMLPKISGWDVLRLARNEGKVFPVILLSARDEEVDRVAGLELGADDYVTKPFSPRELVARVRAQLRRASATGTHISANGTNMISPEPETSPETTPEVAPGHAPAHVFGADYAPTYAPAAQETAYVHTPQPQFSPGAIHVGPIVVDESAREVFIAGKPVELTAKEFDLLAYMANQPGRVFTRDILLSAVWGYEFEGDTRTVDVHISRLRQKLDPALTWDSNSGQSIIATVRGVGYKLLAKEAMS
jgi:two-component system alkaline phosphatase synthesis response regulator PhoP